MLDNLRNQSGDTPFFQEEEPQPESEDKKPKVVHHRSGWTFDQLTGTTAFQRFILALMLFVMICLIGFMLLVLTGKLIPNFLY